jgi:hypothetical protein
MSDLVLHFEAYLSFGLVENATVVAFGSRAQGLQFLVVQLFVSI